MSSNGESGLLAAGVGLCVLGGGFICGSLGLQQRTLKQKEELETIRNMPTTGVNAAVKLAMRRGLGKSAYVDLSGQSWTAEPLKSRDGLNALAIKTSKIEVREIYSWKEGARIYETKQVMVDGQTKMQRVDTGRRETGEWIPERQTRVLEKKTVVAGSGVCFRQLGATESFLSSPAQVCLNLDQIKLDDIMQCQKETMEFEPSNAAPSVIVNVNVNTSSDQHEPPKKPPPQVLGVEKRERIIPMGKEIYALGNVASRYSASVSGGPEGEGVVAMLSPAVGKPFIFGFHSKEYYQDQMAHNISSAESTAPILKCIGYGGLFLGGLSLIATCARATP